MSNGLTLDDKLKFLQREVKDVDFQYAESWQANYGGFILATECGLLHLDKCLHLHNINQKLLYLV